MTALGIRRGCAKALIAAGVVSVTLSGSSGCGRLGYTNRVLWRVPSPDGSMLAVCQEMPEFDGPGYDVRLEQPDGTIRRRLYQIGDGDPCTEMAWSPDGRTLAVLSGHVARVRFVDVARALNDAAPTAHWSWPQVDLSTAHQPRLGKNLRFVGAQDVEVTTCAYDLKVTQQTRRTTCSLEEIRQRVANPLAVHAARRE
jgi:hypothetical protein